DDRVDFDSGHAGTAVGNRAQNVDATTGTDDRVGSMRPEDVYRRRWSGHQLPLPFHLAEMLRVGVHDVGVGVGIDDDDAGTVRRAINLHSRQRIPAGELYI